MSDSKPPPPAAEPALPAKPAAPTGAEPVATMSKPLPERNPALRMLGLPRLPRKLPSRNWMIFIALSSSFAAAIIYDKREKKRATAKWMHTVEHLAKEPISNPSQMPRKLTVYMASPPGDGLRAAQDHFIEYVKPILNASGLDWDYVQGRQQGDVRAALAERIRRERRLQERPDEEQLPTAENLVEAIRKRNQTPEWTGIRGDVVIGRHVWKEYMRGLHEGWLGPLDLPPSPETEAAGSPPGENGEDGKEKEKKTEEKEKDKRPPQPPAYNSTTDYPSASLPLMIPSEFSPATPIPLPHLLGFSSTFTRLGRFLNRRKLADDIGREVAAACLAASREWRETPDQQYEQEGVLAAEERDWVKAVWKDPKPEKKKDEEGKDGEAAQPEPPKEKIWASPMVIDPRIAMRMRRFEMQPEDEARAQRVVVLEEEVEGWIKGSLRSVVRWGVESWKGEPKKTPIVTDEDSD